MYVPAIYNSLVVKKKTTILILFYNEDYYVKIPVSSNLSKWSFDNECNTIIVSFNRIDITWSKLIHRLNHSIFTFEGIFFEKIKFNGKGFKITFKRKKKFLNFMFGHSHMKVMFLKNTWIRRLTKYKYILKSKNIHKLKQTARTIAKVRSLNIYTKRGLRRTRQFVFKRRGKKSTYV